MWASWVLSSHAFADMTLHFYDLADRLTENEDRGYNRYLSDLIGEYDAPLVKKYAPLKRNTRNFIKGKNACAFPANVNAIGASYPEVFTKAIRISEPIDLVAVYVYVPKGNETPKTLSDLHHKDIGHIIGNAAAAFIKDAPINLHAARNNENLLRMLKAGRIEGIMGFHPDMAIAFDDLGYRDLTYSSDLTLLSVMTHFVCNDTKETRRFLDYVDQRIRRMAIDGRAQEYLGEHAQIPNFSLEK